MDKQVITFTLLEVLLEQVHWSSNLDTIGKHPTIGKKSSASLSSRATLLHARHAHC